MLQFLFLNPRGDNLPQNINILMTSILKNLIVRYKEQIRKQDHWKETSKINQIDLQRCQKYGSTLLDIITDFLIDEDQYQKVDQKSFIKRKKHLSDQLSTKQKISQDVIQRTLGLYLRDCFQKYEQWQKLKEQCEIALEDYFDYDSDQDIISQALDTEVSYPISSIKGFDNNQSQFSLVDKWENQIDINHQQNYALVIQYLQNLSSPQSELNYLCQHFGWRTRFEDKRTSQGQFQVTAVVQFQFKRIKQELRESGMAQNKKFGRMFSSFRMLKKIYLSFPQIWVTFNKLRSDKSYTVPQNRDISMSILNSSKIAIQKVEPIVRMQKPEKQMEQKKKQKEIQLKMYLSDVANFKAEMNILIQQVPHTFIFPKMQKMQYNNLWRVKGTLEYRSSNHADNKVYMEVQDNPNSKSAEQLVAKKLLTTMYSQHPQILDIMIHIKKKKGIKT